MDDILIDVKKNLILEHSEDDDLLMGFISAAIAYAEKYQHLKDDFYKENDISLTTRQAVIMLASHLYESRDGATAGFYADDTGAAQQVWNTVNMLLRLDRNWEV
ncbi:MAG: head-tail connector protein [Eubacterium coprostanoligenes]|nr:head-tail connector protein [Eubacterium coprostanoligenes]